MRAEKQLLLDEIKEKIEASNAMVLFEYSKFGPNVAEELRSGLSKAGGDLLVTRKRIFLKAASEAGITFNEDELHGHLAVMFANEDDTVGTTKSLFKFGKDNSDVVEVLAGMFDGKVCSPSEVKQISTLPTRDELRASFLSVLEAPMAGTLSSMNALLTSVIYCLDNKSKKSEK